MLKLETGIEEFDRRFTSEWLAGQVAVVHEFMARFGRDYFCGLNPDNTEFCVYSGSSDFQGLHLDCCEIAPFMILTGEVGEVAAFVEALVVIAKLERGYGGYTFYRFVC